MAKKEEIVKKTSNVVSEEDLDEDLDTEEVIEEGEDDFSEEEEEEEFDAGDEI